MKLVLFLVFFLTLYTYLLYPILLFVLVKVIGGDADKNRENNSKYPSVGIACAMYNEEKVVCDKIENFLNLNYSNLKLYVGSDGSTDGTNELLRQYTRNEKIVIFEYARRGKVYVINDLINETKEDVIVFTDANSMFEPNAVTELVKYFSDPQVGAVCGRLKIVNDEKASGEEFYWRYETAIKKLESRLNSVIGANGAIYAVRRQLLSPLPVNTINDDFMNSMRVIEQGYGTKYAEDAIAYEETTLDDSEEFKRHVRDGAGHYRAMGHLYRLLNILRFKTFFLYTSHRVIRWLVPFYLIIMLAFPLFSLEDPVVRKFFYLEIAFYVFVLIGWLSKTKIKLFYVPYYFIYINIALFLGFIKNITGMQKVAWNRTSR